jgi:hypothetical protein
MLEAGVTYIADRGYVCFQLFHDIGAGQAHFIIRATSNSPFAPSGSNYLNFKPPVESAPQSQPLEDVFL